MVDFNKIDLKSAMLMILSLLGIYGTLKVAEFVYLLIIGVTAEVALSGSVAVPVSINTSLNDTLNSVSTGYTLFHAAELVVLGLIALVVIIQVFWPLISQFMPKKGKDSMN